MAEKNNFSRENDNEKLENFFKEVEGILNNFFEEVDESLDENEEKINEKNSENETDISEKIPKNKKEDVVNHPAHYNRDGAMECIDEMIELFGIKEVMSYCKLNAWKYRYRAADKNGYEDLQKSDWYLKKYVELKEEKMKLIGNGVASWK